MDAMENTHTVDWATVATRLFICIAGIVGNLMVIFVIVVLREYKKAVTHWYVLQLAIADSVFLLTLPFKIVEDVENEWTFDAGMCKAKETILFLNYYASILFLMIMSIDRYIAVCHGFSDELQKYRTHRAAYVITGVTWCIALLLCIPVMMYSDKVGTEPNCLCSYIFPEDKASPEEDCASQGFHSGADLQLCLDVAKESASHGSCKPDPDSYDSGSYGDYSGSGYDYAEYYDTNTNLTGVIGAGCNYSKSGRLWSGFLIFNFMGMFLLPFFVMAFCYTMIILKLRETKVKTFRNASHSVTSTSALTVTSERSSTKRITRNRSKSAASIKASSERNRVTVMCAVLVSLFVVCWLPFHSVHMAKVKGMEIYVENEKWCNLLPIIASMIAYMNSALNPYLYNFLGTRFGKRFGGAVATVRQSVKNRTSSVSSGMAVSYRKKKKTSVTEGSSQGATITTKIYKGREVDSSAFSENGKQGIGRNSENNTNSDENRPLQTSVAQNSEAGEQQKLLLV